MQFIMTLITPHCRFYRVNNLSSCSQDIIDWIFSNQYYILFHLAMVQLPP
jgi:hypothetical protein